MVKINLIGNIFGTTGYARHTKELLKSLSNSESITKIRLDCPKVDGWERLVSDAELNAITNKYTNDMVQIAITTPNNWPFYYTDPCKAFYGFLVWEGTKVPKFWERYVNDYRVTAIFVPSTHVKHAIENTFNCKKPIYIIPHGVDPLKFQINEEIANKKRPFTFLVNKGWNLTEKDRGGVPITVKAFTEEFKDDENVRLILKINPAYLQGGSEQLENAFKKLSLPDKRPKIHVDINNLTDEGLVKMYSESDVIINTSYAEGFNLPLLEAMACGVVPLTSKFGGQMDFCHNYNSFILTEGEFVTPSELQYENSEWFEIDHEYLKHTMRELFLHQTKVKDKVKLLSNTVDKFTWDKTAQKIIKVIQNHDK